MSDDHKALLRSPASSGFEFDLEAQPSPPVLSPSGRRSGIGELLKNLDRKLSGRRLRQRQSPLPAFDQAHDELGDGASPEWALLLIGCLLGLATGLCVAAFNRALRKGERCKMRTANGVRALDEIRDEAKSKGKNAKSLLNPGHYPQIWG